MDGDWTHEVTGSSGLKWKCKIIDGVLHMDHPRWGHLKALAKNKTVEECYAAKGYKVVKLNQFKGN